MGANDSALQAACEREQRILVTLDTDFSRHAPLRSGPLGGRHCVASKRSIHSRVLRVPRWRDSCAGDGAHSGEPVDCRTTTRPKSRPSDRCLTRPPPSPAGTADHATTADPSSSACCNSSTASLRIHFIPIAPCSLAFPPTTGKVNDEPSRSSVNSLPGAGRRVKPLSLERIMIASCCPGRMT